MLIAIITVVLTLILYFPHSFCLLISCLFIQSFICIRETHGYHFILCLIVQHWVICLLNICYTHISSSSAPLGALWLASVSSWRSASCGFLSTSLPSGIAWFQAHLIIFSLPPVLHGAWWLSLQATLRNRTWQWMSSLILGAPAAGPPTTALSVYVLIIFFSGNTLKSLYLSLRVRTGFLSLITCNGISQSF